MHCHSSFDASSSSTAIARRSLFDMCVAANGRARSTEENSIDFVGLLLPKKFTADASNTCLEFVSVRISV